MNGILFTSDWEHKIVEWKFDAKDSPNGKGRYGMIAFGKSKDGNEIDCAYVLYKMDFTLTQNMTAVLQERSILFGLINWNTIGEDKKGISLETINDLQNFFRLRALRLFKDLGVIDKINLDK